MLIRMPGVQKPHCSACASRNACLQGMERAVALGGQAFDCRHARAVGLHREHQAGANGLVVDQHGAGTADAVLAADVRAGELQVMAEEVGEQQARLDFACERGAIDGQSDRDQAGHRATTAKASGKVKRSLEPGAET